MAKTDNLSDFLFDVAEAIRAKKGITNTINPQNFSEEILSIEGGSSGGGDATDLDYIKYHDDMIALETGKIQPTTEEYEQIIEEGYKILDYIFRGEVA